MQGHSPYNSTDYLFGNNWFYGSNYSRETDCIINNYLGSVADTQQYLSNMIDALSNDPNPVVVLLYGDHKPWLGNNSSVAEELNINFDTSSEEGFLNYYSTEYVIWANESAKSICNKDFKGQGNTISTCYLFPLLLQELGWDSCGYSNYLLARMENLNVITSNNTFYENGVFTTSLSPSGLEQYQAAEYVQYYQQFDATIGKD